jgi:hypothetical protein
MIGSGLSGPGRPTGCSTAVAAGLARLGAWIRLAIAGSIAMLLMILCAVCGCAPTSPASAPRPPPPQDDRGGMH